jgi:hypothetical protein
MLVIAESTEVTGQSPSGEPRPWLPRSRRSKLAWDKRYYYQNREKRLDLQRSINYGIQLGTYRAMFIQQEGLCAICRRPETGRYKGRIKSLAVDHDQASGRIRALLCQSCNKGIGAFRHDTARLRAAIVYLNRYSTSFINPFTTHPVGADLKESGQTNLVTPTPRRP